MCGLCGILGAPVHWTDTSSNPDAFRGRAETHTWQRERQERTRLVNRILRHYGLSLSDWAATSYVLRSDTGRTALVDDLSQMWSVAETMSGRACDPLEESLIAALSTGAEDRRRGGA